MKNSYSFWLTTKGIIAACMIAVIVYFLLTEHLAHTIEYLPYVLLLACPFLHMFMHHGHHHSDHSNHEDHSQHNTKK